MSQRSIEAVIALSIGFVAAEIVQSGRSRVGITTRAPWVVALTFSLMHGLGFAGALSEAGLPERRIPLELLFFSGGGELGHILFVGVVLSLLAYGRWVPRLPPYAIGTVAMFWVIQRVATF